MKFQQDEKMEELYKTLRGLTGLCLVHKNTKVDEALLVDSLPSFDSGPLKGPH